MYRNFFVTVRPRSLLRALIDPGANQTHLFRSEGFRRRTEAAATAKSAGAALSTRTTWAARVTPASLSTLTTLATGSTGTALTSGATTTARPAGSAEPWSRQNSIKVV